MSPPIPNFFGKEPPSPTFFIPTASWWGGQRTLRRRVARDLCAHDRWQLLPRKDAIPAPDRAQIPPPLIVTSAKSAELIKHASNAFLAMKISFINAVASICESVGANVHQVCQGIGTDSRIGPRFSQSRHRLRRIVLSQRPDGFPRGSAGVWIRVPAAGRGHAHQ